MRRLPPLNALRAFEAAARHLSFTKAADELHVTPAAVSHQVKALEAHAGVRLFRRLNNGLALTEAAGKYLPLLTEGFDRLVEAGRHLSGDDGSRVTTVSVLHSVATKWLAPRLARFRRIHPQIDLRIDATDRKVDLLRDGIDLAIRYGAGDSSGHHLEELFTDHVFPVCSPRLVAGPKPLEAPGDLRHHTLLHTDWAERHGGSPDWRAWLKTAGVTDIDAARGPRFTLSSMTIEAAIDGQGVALGQWLFAADDIAAGRLVRPFDLSLPLEAAYYLVVPQTAKEDPAAETFRQWIVDEAAQYKALIGTSL